MSGELICRNCGKINEESVDFCEGCGDYLRWDLTRTMPAAIEVQGATPAPMPVPAELVAETSVLDIPDSAAAPEVAPAPDVAHAPALAADLAGGGPIDHGPTGDDGDDDDEFESNTDVLTAVMPALAVPEPQPEPSSVPYTGGATLVVKNVAAVALEQGEAAIAACEPGASVTYDFMLRNVSRVVDNYDLVVAGLPEGWATVTPDTAYLVPYGSGGSSDQLVRVTVTPPRVTEAEARVWPFELVALSRATGGIAARTSAGVDVGPFSAWELTPVPLVRAGRLRGRYAVTVANQGNSPIELWMYATEPEDKLRGRYAHPMLPLSPGEARTTELTVRPLRPRLIGRTLDRFVGIEALPDAPEPEEPRVPLKERAKKYFTPGSVSVGPRGVQIRKPRARMPRPPAKQYKLEDLKRLAASTGPAGPVARTRLTFRHKPLISTWMILLALLIAALIVLFLLTRTHKVTVPALVGYKTTFAAERKLQQDGLTLNPTLQQKRTSAVAPGEILAQDPAAGKKVKKGTQVTLEVAVGTGMVKVPTLTGDTRGRADTVLRQHDLSLGVAEPTSAPLDWIVKSQIPQAGVSVADGTVIQIYLKAPPSNGTNNSKTNTTTTPTHNNSSGKKKSPASALVVPAVDGKSLKVAAAKIRAKGLVPAEQYATDAAVAGDVYSADPAPGTAVKKGTVVTIDVSEGEPELAYGDGTTIHLLNLTTGKSAGKASGPDPIAVEPSFSPDGQEFVYRSASRVFVASTAKPSKVAPIYQGTDPYTNVTFSPDQNRQVLALDRQVNGVGELCLASLAAARLTTSCLPDYSGWSLTGSIAWSPNGREILAHAVSTEDSSYFGLVEYTTQQAFSTIASNWLNHGVVTAVTEPGRGVLAAGFDPANPKLVALVNNLGTSAYGLSLTSASSLDPTNGALTVPVSACQVAWRSDGQDLAVIEGNPGCTQQTGAVAQISLSSLKTATVIATGASDIAYQSLDAASVPH